jgi:hypothetical protein
MVYARSYYDGVCRGGPWSGQQLAYYSTTYVINTPVVEGWGQLGFGPVFGVEKLGEYNFVDDQWLWHARLVTPEAFSS